MALKQPFEFDVALWRGDPAVNRLSALARGVWRELLDVMHELDRSGVITGTAEEIARDGRCSTVELTQTIHELKKYEVADVTDRHGIVTLINRKMKRESEARKRCAERQSRRRNPDVVTPMSHSLKKQETRESDKAYEQALNAGDKKPPLTPDQRDMALEFEETLRSQWLNDAGKWIGRIRTQPGKTGRVLAEVKNAALEKRIKTTAAQYAEQIWKEFK